MAITPTTDPNRKPGSPVEGSKPGETADSAYIPIAVVTLVPSSVAKFSLYSKGREDDYVLYRGDNCEFTQADRDRLLDSGIERLYVTNYQHAGYQNYLRDHLDEFLADEEAPIKERLGGLNAVVRNVLQDSFSKGDTNGTVTSAVQLADQTVQAICRNDVVATDLCSVMFHDYHTFTHSANVACLCVLLGHHLAISTEDLQLIATAALLHDLGKLEIPEKILGKNGRLDEKEFAIIKRHPGTGFAALCQRTDLSHGQLMMVYQHHEDFKGGGYPVGLVGEEIHPWARLCAVADVFEALTSNRPYRRGMSIPDALALMAGRMGDKFQPEILACLQKAINNN